MCASVATSGDADLRPPSPLTNSDAEASRDDSKQISTAACPYSTLTLCSFCRKHAISPGSLPAANGPAADPGASLSKLLDEGVTPVGCTEYLLQRRAHPEQFDPTTAARVHAAQRKPPPARPCTLHTQKAFCGRLVFHGHQATADGRFVVRLYIRDAAGLIIDVEHHDAELSAMPAAAFAREAVARFPSNSAVALIGVFVKNCVDEHVSSRCMHSGLSRTIATRTDEFREGRCFPEVRRYGDVLLPEVHLSQVCVL